jgi:hypothetical protein
VVQCIGKGQPLSEIFSQEAANETVRYKEKSRMVKIKVKNYQPSSFRFLPYSLPMDFTIKNASVNVSLVFIFDERTRSSKPREKEIKYNSKHHGVNRLHGEDNNTNTPTIYKIVVPFLVVLLDNFKRQITWSCTHSLAI